MKKPVLIVDDCGTTRKLLSYMIREKGYVTVTADNGIDALEKLATNPVDLVLTDLNMPHMDGIELVKNIRANEVYEGLPIIMITTESGELDKETAFEAGVTAFLIKPVTPKKLVEEIEKLL